MVGRDGPCERLPRRCRGGSRRPKAPDTGNDHHRVRTPATCASCRRSSRRAVRAAWTSPPLADTRASPRSRKNGWKTITPDRLHEPPRASGAAARSTGSPPSSAIFMSLAVGEERDGIAVRRPEWLFGACTAGQRVASSVARSRTNRGLSDCPSATNATRAVGRHDRLRTQRHSLWEATR